MTCTTQDCNNVQCYVCSESCDYSHFNDLTRGGKKGNCPLFDNVVDRHKSDVSKAEKAARAKFLQEQPDLASDLPEVRAPKMNGERVRQPEDLISPALWGILSRQGYIQHF